MRTSDNPPSSTPKYVLFTCNVRSDGIGDLGHFTDITKGILDTNEFKDSGLTPLFLISGASRRELKFRNLLVAKGFNPDDKNFKIILDVSDVTELQSPEWMKKFNEIKAIFNISTPDLDIYYPESRPLQNFLQTQFNHSVTPSTTFIEHGGVSYKAKNTPQSLFVVMDVKNFGKGLCLKKNNEKHTPAECLATVRPDLLNELLSKSKDETGVEPSLTVTDTTQFLDKSLIMPCYYQGVEAPQTLITMINGVAASEISRGKEEITVVANPISIFQNRQYYEELVGNNISEITIVTCSSEQKITRETIHNRHQSQADNEAKGLRVRILVGFNPDEKDFNVLHQCAQIGGSSGDKSFEQVLSHSLIPLAQIRMWKIKFFDHLTDYIDNLLGKDNLITPYFQILKNLYQINENFFESACEFYHTPQVPHDLGAIVDAFLENSDARANYFQELKGLSNQMGRMLTTEFKQQWLIVLNDLHTNQNLYHNLPEIVRNTLINIPDLAAKDLMRKGPTSS